MARKLRLRRGYEPPDDAFVIRGGRMNILDIANSLEKCREESGVLGFSVLVTEAHTVNAACRTVNLPHPSVCWSTAGRLRGLDGVELLPTGTAPHFTVVLGNSDREIVEAVLDVFEGPIRNAARD